jgi:alpha-N-arabinofuranosidase
MPLNPATAEVVIGDPAHPVPPLLFGGLAEHFGTSVNDGMFDRRTRAARPDVKSALAAMGTRLIRYPGGCYSSAYHWKDGIGPQESRPRYERTIWTDIVASLPGLVPAGGTRRTPGLTLEELSLRSGPPEPNIVGTDEFLQYCLDLDAEPFLVANLGTGTTQEAADWVRYTNIDRRAPRRVQYWGVGNENWGTHEPGAAPPREYGRRLAEYAAAMKAVDPSITVVGVGLGVRPSDGDADLDRSFRAYTGTEWIAGVLEEAGDHIDALNLHWYFPGMIGRPLSGEDDYRQLVTAPDLLDDVLDRTVDLLGRLDPDGRIFIAVDEWNRMVEVEDHLSTNHTLADAPFFAGGFIALLRHAGIVRIGCLSHLVNCLGPVQAGDGWMFTTAAFQIAQLFGTLARGTTRTTSVVSESVDVPALADLNIGLTPMSNLGARTGEGLVALATEDDATQVVFLASRHLDRPTDVEVVGLADVEEATLRLLTGPDLYAANTVEHPDVLHFAEQPVQVVAGRARFRLPPGGTGALVLRPSTS